MTRRKWPASSVEASISLRRLERSTSQSAVLELPSLKIKRATKQTYLKYHLFLNMYSIRNALYNYGNVLDLLGNWRNGINEGKIPKDAKSVDSCSLGLPGVGGG